MFHMQIIRIWKVKEDLYVADKPTFKGHQVVVPASRHYIAGVEGCSLGVQKCKVRARSCVYWPSINSAIKQEIKCPACNTHCKASLKEPLIPHAIPTRPWEKVSTDYFNRLSFDDSVITFPNILK